MNRFSPPNPIGWVFTQSNAYSPSDLSAAARTTLLQRLIQEDRVLMDLVSRYEQGWYVLAQLGTRTLHLTLFDVATPEPRCFYHRGYENYSLFALSASGTLTQIADSRREDILHMPILSTATRTLLADERALLDVYREFSNTPTPPLTHY